MKRSVGEERAACLFALFAVSVVLFGLLNLVDDGEDWGDYIPFPLLLINHYPPPSAAIPLLRPQL